jgi:hypothetical protein
MKHFTISVAAVLLGGALGAMAQSGTVPNTPVYLNCRIEPGQWEELRKMIERNHP